MSLEIVIDKDTGIAVGTFTGHLSLVDLKQAAVAIWGNQEFTGSAILWDLSGASFSLDSGEVQELAAFTKSGSKLPRPARMAFLVGGDLEFGLVRMFEVYREEPGIGVRVFREYDVAVDWLKSDSVDERERDDA